MAELNHKYLMDNFGVREDVKAIFSDTRKCRREIKQKLAKLEHCPMDRLYLDVRLPIGGLENCSSRMLLRIHLLLDALKTRGFRWEVGALLERDKFDDNLKDHPLIFPVEFGGLGRIYFGRLIILPLPSLDTFRLRPGAVKEEVLPSNRDGNTNGFYVMPMWARDIPNAFFFHFHLADGEMGYVCWPSYSVTDEGKFSYSYDIGSALVEIDKYGESHRVIFAKLPGRKFSVVYYGGELDSGSKPFLVEVSLGIHSY